MPILDALDLSVPAALLAAFAALRRDLIADIQPVNSLQEELFNQALRHAWMIRRCDAAHRDLAAETPGADPLVANPQAFDRLERHRHQAERGYRQALAELRRLQTDRAVRMLAPHQGLLALPALIETKTYIPAARAARGLKPRQPIHFAPHAAALDQFVRQRNLGDHAWDAWHRRRATPTQSTTGGS